mmetsp:Transcript_53473/g.148193  ORF Transcript_53473/g.148193 Transcript_53473/m.148193 type:complete len:304 (-) Transcript_53473:79-990(-)
MASGISRVVDRASQSRLGLCREKCEYRAARKSIRAGMLVDSCRHTTTTPVFVECVDFRVQRCLICLPMHGMRAENSQGFRRQTALAKLQTFSADAMDRVRESNASDALERLLRSHRQNVDQTGSTERVRHNKHLTGCTALNHLLPCMHTMACVQFTVMWIIVVIRIEHHLRHACLSSNTQEVKHRAVPKTVSCTEGTAPDARPTANTGYQDQQVPTMFSCPSACKDVAADLVPTAELKALEAARGLCQGVQDVRSDTGRQLLVVPFEGITRIQLPLRCVPEAAIPAEKPSQSMQGRGHALRPC